MDAYIARPLQRVSGAAPLREIQERDQKGCRRYRRDLRSAASLPEWSCSRTNARKLEILRYTARIRSRKGQCGPQTRVRARRTHKVRRLYPRTWERRQNAHERASSGAAPPHNNIRSTKTGKCACCNAPEPQKTIKDPKGGPRVSHGLLQPSGPGKHDSRPYIPRKPG